MKMHLAKHFFHSSLIPFTSYIVVFTFDVPIVFHVVIQPAIAIKCDGGMYCIDVDVETYKTNQHAFGQIFRHTK